MSKYQKAQTLVAQAEQYMESEQWELAIRDCNQAITLDRRSESHAKAVMIRAICFKNTDQWALAIEDFTNAAALLESRNGRKIPVVYELRGACYLETGRPNLALEDFNQALRLEPWGSEMRRKRGQYAQQLAEHASPYEENKQWELAIQYYTQALTLDSSLVQALVGRSLCFFHSEQWALAVKDFAKAAALVPNLPESFYSLRGECYRRLDEWALSISDYSRLISSKQGTAVTYESRGECYLETGKAELALEDFNEALRLDPNYVSARVHRGKCYFRKSQWDLAIADLTEAIRLDPKNVLACWMRAGCYFYKEEWRLAIGDITEFLRLKPDTPSVDLVYALRAQCYLNLGEQSMAERDIAEANLRANLTQEQGNYGSGKLDFPVVMNCDVPDFTDVPRPPRAEEKLPKQTIVPKWMERLVLLACAIALVVAVLALLYHLGHG